MRRILEQLLCVFLGGAALAQTDPPAQPAPDPLADMMKLFAEAGIVLDTEARTVSVPCEIGHPDQPLEFLLCHRRGKAHEALLLTQVKASVLNAALIALGLEPGKNARIVDKDPMPTIEQIENGAAMFDIFPPEGTAVWFTVSWEKEPGGERQEVPAEDMILDLTTEQSVDAPSWIYLGGNTAPIYRNEPPVFVGDFEGNLISIVYKTPPNHLVTMRHERASNDQIWWLTELVPPPGTPVRLTIHCRKPPVVEKRDAQRKKTGDGAPAPDKAPPDPKKD
jgi:hypothetical protein